MLGVYKPQIFPSLLGASASIAFAAFSGTALFNGFAWLHAGPGVSFADASSAADNSLVYAVLSVATVGAADVLGGMAAAKLSTRTSYVNALASALLVLVWSLVLIASPVAAAQADAVTIIEGFVFPIPCALLGAWMFNSWPWHSHNQ